MQVLPHWVILYWRDPLSYGCSPSPWKGEGEHGLVSLSWAPCYQYRECTSILLRYRRLPLSC